MWITPQCVVARKVSVRRTWCHGSNGEPRPSEGREDDDFRTFLPIGDGRLSTAPVTAANVNTGPRIAQEFFVGRRVFLGGAVSGDGPCDWEVDVGGGCGV